MIIDSVLYISTSLITFHFVTIVPSNFVNHMRFFVIWNVNIEKLFFFNVWALCVISMLCGLKMLFSYSDKTGVYGNSVKYCLSVFITEVMNTFSGIVFIGFS